jgi:hypothetical protein
MAFEVLEKLTNREATSKLDDKVGRTSPTASARGLEWVDPFRALASANGSASFIGIGPPP